MKYIVFSDGGARGNPGIAGVGCAVYKKDFIGDINNTLIDEIIESNPIATYHEFIGKTTNSVSEWTGVLKGLELIRFILKKNGENAADTEVFGFTDSELVQKQIMGLYRVKDVKMKEKYSEFLNKKALFKKVIYTHIPREKNKLCDKLSNEAMDEGKIMNNT